MKKYIVFSLLCGLIGITYLQAPPLPKTPSKRAWACRNTGRQFSKSTQERLAKNKCTEAEIRAGQSLRHKLHVGAVIGIPLAVGGAIAAVDHVQEKKLESKYGKNILRGKWSEKSPLYE